METLGRCVGIDWVGWVCLLVGFALWMFLYEIGCAVLSEQK